MKRQQINLSVKKRTQRHRRLYDFNKNIQLTTFQLNKKESLCGQGTFPATLNFSFLIFSFTFATPSFTNTHSYSALASSKEFP